MAGYTLAVAIATPSTLKLVEALLHFRLPTDVLLFGSSFGASCAITFSLASGALALVFSRRGRTSVQCIALLMSLIAAFPALAFLFKAPSLYETNGYTAMMPLECVGILVMAFGLGSLNPKHGLFAHLGRKHSSTWVTRVLLSTAIILPFIGGLLASRSAGFDEHARGVLVIFVFAQIVLFGGSVCISSYLLARSEEEEEGTRQALAASERMLQQSQKMEAIGALAGGLAHDFNNLLNVISGYSELLIGDSSLGELQRSKIEKIAKAGQTAAGLTRQLLAFSRRQVLQPQALDLNSVISSKDGYLHRLIKEDIDLSTSLDPGLMATLIDPTQLEQILLNLVINACDAMPHGGRLSIATTNIVLEQRAAAEHGVKPGAFVRLSITDSGTGMDEHTRQHIFEPFFTTKAVGKGTGLGLATVYGIVKQSGGFIQVDSKLGRGTTFFVFLPAARMPMPIAPASAATTEIAGNATVLVVEDSELLRELVFETLESMGYTVLMAKDGREAIRLCSQFSGTIDLVLSDVIMPKMNGPEVVKKIREIRSELAVLFMSGYANEVTLQHGISRAEAAFIQKPFTSTDLRNKVREVLVQAQERRTLRRQLTAMMSESHRPVGARNLE
jgi:signal transduction histidine kinase/CheY-like chemotaxis protein